MSQRHPSSEDLAVWIVPSKEIGRDRMLTTYSQGAQMVKNLPTVWETRGSIPGSGRSPGGGHGCPLQGFLPGESPWTEEPGGLQSTGCRVGQD